MVPSDPLEQNGAPPTRLGSNEGFSRLTTELTLTVWREWDAVSLEIGVETAPTGVTKIARRKIELRMDRILNLDLFRFTNLHRTHVSAL